MSTNELAAAERLRQVGRNRDGRNARYISSVYEGTQFDYRTDLDTVAMAYLSLIRPDSDEPITEEWLRSVGFEREDETCMYRLRFDACSYKSNVVIGLPVHFAAIEQVDGAGPEHDDRDDSCVQIKFPSTRGQLRALAGALGITLNDPQAE
jgi:hypothetical protein